VAGDGFDELKSTCLLVSHMAGCHMWHHMAGCHTWQLLEFDAETLEALYYILFVCKTTNLKNKIDKL